MSRKWSLLPRNSVPAIFAALIASALAPAAAFGQFVSGTEFPVASPVAETHSRAGNVDVASDGITALAVWSDRRTDRGSEIIAARMDRLGRVLDPNGIVITSTLESEGDPFVVYDGSHFVVVWGDGTNTWAAKLTDRGVISSEPTILAPGRPTGLALNVRILGVAITNAQGTTISEIRADLTLRELERLRSVPDVQLAPLGFGFLAVYVETPFNPIGNFTVSSLRIDRRGAIGHGETITELGVFERRPTFAVGTLGEEAVIAAGQEDHMAVVRMDSSGAVTLIDRDDTFTPRVIYDVVSRNNSVDVLASVDSRAVVYHYASATIDDFVAVTGAPSDGAGTIHNARVYTVWQVAGQIVGRFAFSEPDEPAIFLSRAVPNQQHPALATSGSSSIAVWTEDVTDTRDRIMARILNDDGSPDPTLGPIVLATRTIHFAASRPAVGFNGTHYFVAWLDQRNDATRPAVLVMRQVTTRGVVFSASEISATAIPSSPPAIASGPGNALLVFTESINNPQLRGVMVNEPGVELDIPGITNNPSAVYGDGSYLVVGGTAGGGIRGALVSSTGTFERTVFETVPPFGVTDSKASVAWSGNGYLVVFRRGTSIYGRFLTRSGDVVGPDFPITHDTIADNPRVAFDGHAYVVAWSVKTTDAANAEGDIFAARVLLTGDVLLPQLIATGARNEDYPALVGLGGSRSLIGYQRMTAELQNVHRVYARVLTAPLPPPTTTKRRAVR